MFIGDLISIAIILLFPVESFWTDVDSSLFHATAMPPFPLGSLKFEISSNVSLHITHMSIFGNTKANDSFWNYKLLQAYIFWMKQVPVVY
jgi:hypothetical protein